MCVCGGGSLGAETASGSILGGRVGVSDGQVVGSEWCGELKQTCLEAWPLYVVDGELTEGLRNRD